MSNGCREGRHPYLIPELKEKGFSVSLLSILIVGVFVDVLYLIEEIVFCYTLAEN